MKGNENEGAWEELALKVSHVDSSLTNQTFTARAYCIVAPLPDAIAVFGGVDKNGLVDQVCMLFPNDNEHKLVIQGDKINASVFEWYSSPIVDVSTRTVFTVHTSYDNKLRQNKF